MTPWLTNARRICNRRRAALLTEVMMVMGRLLIMVVRVAISVMLMMRADGHGMGLWRPRVGLQVRRVHGICGQRHKHSIRGGCLMLGPPSTYAWSKKWMIQGMDKLSIWMKGGRTISPAYAMLVVSGSVLDGVLTGPRPGPSSPPTPLLVVISACLSFLVKLTTESKSLTTPVQLPQSMRAAGRRRVPSDDLIKAPTPNATISVASHVMALDAEARLRSPHSPYGRACCGPRLVTWP